MIFVVFPPLKDDDPYVRKTAAICVAKLFDINAELVQDRGFVDTLKEMLGTPTPWSSPTPVRYLSPGCAGIPRPRR